MFSKKEYQLVKAFLTIALFKKDGSRTKFARKYNIKNYRDFYAFFKLLKQNLKNDREGIAFGMIKDLAKSYVGRVWVRMPGEDQETKVFNAWSHTFDMISLILDNLNVLRQALTQMDKEEGLLKEDIEEVSPEANEDQTVVTSILDELRAALKR